ncbi:Polynucleotidyl transferase ribonuclease H-like superfamily protein [Euphorbia peplus]|nr:Polynucleotidyl transferase ribonuclease H-like superfamily protein [Euphorbia peplus]
MKTLTACFSILQVPRCKLQSLAYFWQESFYSLPGKCANLSKFRLLSSKSDGYKGSYAYKGSYSRKSIGNYSRSIGKKPDELTTDSSKSASYTHETWDEAVSTSATLNVNKAEISELHKLQYTDIQPKVVENKETANVTVIVFDIETTGFSRDKDRIIEIALQDLQGGENSTFQSLVNPGSRSIPNSHVHGITSHMVKRPGVPSMEELIPILLQYIRSRQKKGGYVMLVAHNSRSFDVHFLNNEFKRYGFDIPPDWLFVDTLPLAREWMKSQGSETPTKTSLQALCNTFQIKFVGTAHRAMADVNALSLVFQRLSLDLKLSPVKLVELSFTASDLSSAKKKNSR